jgi:hypothetical protein
MSCCGSERCLGPHIEMWVSRKTTSNFCIDRSAKQLRCLVPVALLAPAPGHAERWAA